MTTSAAEACTCSVSSVNLPDPMYVPGMMPCRFCVSSATMIAPAVSARPRSSSSGSSPIHGRSGSATLTRMAFSRLTVSSSRGMSINSDISEFGFRNFKPLRLAASL
jgi:hypothetical protein